MRHLVILILIAGLAWYGYSRYRAARPETTPPATESASPFKCDGRTRCSQMTSCEEATYFIRHCPNTQMDGDNDRVPCERQLCR